MDVYTYNIYSKTNDIYRVSFSFGVLHFVRPLRCINVRHISRRVLRCALLCVRVYSGSDVFVVVVLYLLLVGVLCLFFLSSGWLFGVYFSRVLQLYVIVQIHNEVGTNGTPCTHANVPRVKCAVVIFFTGWLPLFFFHSFESIKYEICFYSFGGYWTIVTAAEVTAFRGRWFLRAFATSKFKINTTNYFQ